MKIIILKNVNICSDEASDSKTTTAVVVKTTCSCDLCEIFEVKFDCVRDRRGGLISLWWSFLSDRKWASCTSCLCDVRPQEGLKRTITQTEKKNEAAKLQ